LAVSNHIWYPTWKYQKNKPGFPWKDDPAAFMRWLELANYNPRNGDIIRQYCDDDYYRLWIVKRDGTCRKKDYVRKNNAEG
jgi:hypothetical protein